MQIKLISDFSDYYDGQFQKAEPLLNPDQHTFLRQTTTKRADDFALLQDLGFVVPTYGQPSEVLSKIIEQNPNFSPEHIKEITEVVVYFDDEAHQGLGKLLMPISTAIEKYPNKLCALHVKTGETGSSSSLQYLCIGKRQFWLQYISTSDWRSNCGEHSIKVLGEEERKKDFGILPMFSIDFIERGSMMIAVDFNQAPRLSRTGIEAFGLHPSHIYDEVKAALEARN